MATAPGTRWPPWLAAETMTETQRFARDDALAFARRACRAAGATGARVVRHASSYETLAHIAPQPPIDAVGYAAVVVS